MKLIDRMTRVCKAAVKAKDADFEVNFTSKSASFALVGLILLSLQHDLHKFTQSISLLVVSCTTVYVTSVFIYNTVSNPQRIISHLCSSTQLSADF